MAGLACEFSDGIFNALVEKIEIISPTHFVFVVEKWDAGGGKIYIIIEIIYRKG